MVKKIELTKGAFTLVDEKDFRYLNQWRWQLHTGGYAYRTSTDGVHYMHREVNETPEDMLTDHINGDKLDNRRNNLRNASRSLNAVNTGLRSTNKSGYNGVSWSKLHKQWEAYIWKDNKKYHLGLFKNVLDASKVRKKAEIIYHV